MVRDIAHVGPSSALMGFLVVYYCSVLPMFALIFRKAGFSGWHAAWFVLPPLGIVGLAILAARCWPIQHELSRLRVIAGESTEADVETLINLAYLTEHRGNFQGALTLYQSAVENATDETVRQYAMNCIKALNEKRALSGQA